MEGRGLSSAGVFHNILGVGFSSIKPGRRRRGHRALDRRAQQRSRNYVCITGVHGVMESRRERFWQASRRASIRRLSHAVINQFPA
jgi:hypothetical protein